MYYRHLFVVSYEQFYLYFLEFKQFQKQRTLSTTSAESTTLNELISNIEVDKLANVSSKHGSNFVWCHQIFIIIPLQLMWEGKYLAHFLLLRNHRLTRTIRPYCRRQLSLRNHKHWKNPMFSIKRNTIDHHFSFEKCSKNNSAYSQLFCLLPIFSLLCSSQFCVRPNATYHVTCYLLKPSIKVKLYSN